MNPQIFAMLSDRGSLTEKFANMMGEKPVLTRLTQKHQLVSADERSLLNIQPRQVALVREILMGTRETPWMFARTLVPQATLKGAGRRIACLNSKPIGKILFGRNGAKRQSMAISLCADFPATLNNSGISLTVPLWQRQSLFELMGQPLMVTEIFLSGCPIYQCSDYQRPDNQRPEFQRPGNQYQRIDCDSDIKPMIDS